MSVELRPLEPAAAVEARLHVFTVPGTVKTLLVAGNRVTFLTVPGTVKASLP
jgi:hypothetical protein